MRDTWGGAECEYAAHCAAAGACEGGEVEAGAVLLLRLGSWLGLRLLSCGLNLRSELRLDLRRRVRLTLSHRRRLSLSGRCRRRRGNGGHGRRHRGISVGRRRGRGEVPRAGDKRGRHDPRRGADDALALVLVADRAELRVDVLRDVAHEGHELAHATAGDRERGEEVDDRVCDGGDVLRG